MGKPAKDLSPSSLKRRLFDPLVNLRQRNKKSKLSGITSILNDVKITPSGNEAIKCIRLIMDLCGIPWKRLDQAPQRFDFPEPIPLQDGQIPMPKDEEQLLKKGSLKKILSHRIQKEGSQCPNSQEEELLTGVNQ